LVHQLVTGEDAPRPRDQRPQQPELSPRQRHVGPRDGGLVTRGVDHQVADLDAPDLLLVRHAASAQNRPHARDQLARPERLGHVVVGAHLETDHDVRFLALGGQHHDRRPARLLALAQAAADLEAVQPGQHQVQQDQLRLPADGLLEALLAVRRGEDAEALALEVVPDHLDDVGVVLDDQDRRFRHGVGPLG
jgi:hypothetical protein